jgi:membrane protein
MQGLNMLLSILVITGVFAVLFKYLPDVRITWGDVLLGAAFTAVLFTIGKFLIGLYLGKASFGSTYGAAGSLVIVLVWVYYSSQILFFGAEFTQVYARSHGTDPLHIRRRGPAQPQKAKRNPGLEHTTAAGNAGLQSDTDEKAAGVFGSLVGSALAVTRIVRGFRR